MKYICWVDKGYSGWTPNWCDSLEECLRLEKYGSPFLITSEEIEYEVRLKDNKK